jgi:hypothetical protein
LLFFKQFLRASCGFVQQLTQTKGKISMEIKKSPRQDTVSYFATGIFIKKEPINNLLYLQKIRKVAL